MPKQTIEIDIPYGWEFVRFGRVKKGELYIIDGEACPWNSVDHSACNYIIVRPIERWRVPTKLDLLNKYAIECRWRDASNAEWSQGVLTAIRGPDPGQFYIAPRAHWCWHCEIRDTEPKPREAWVRFNSNGFHSFCEDNPGYHDGCVEVRHYIEVPE